MKHGKHYVDAAKQVDFSKLYDMNEALELACKTASAKFDETVELHVRLGVDGRHADQQVRADRTHRRRFHGLRRCCHHPRHDGPRWPSW